MRFWQKIIWSKGSGKEIQLATFVLIMNLCLTYSSNAAQLRLCGQLWQNALGATNVPRSFDQCWNWCDKWLPAGKQFHTVGIAAVCWAIWKARNKVCFEGNPLLNPIAIICHACALMSYWAGLYEGEDRKALEDGVNACMKVKTGRHWRTVLTPCFGSLSGFRARRRRGTTSWCSRMRKMTSSSTNGIELIFATVNCCSQWESSSFCGSSVIMASALSGLEMLWDRLHMGNTFAGVCFCYLLAWSKGGRKFGKVG